MTKAWEEYWEVFLHLLQKKAKAPELVVQQAIQTCFLATHGGSRTNQRTRALQAQEPITMVHRSELLTTHEINCGIRNCIKTFVSMGELELGEYYNHGGIGRSSKVLLKPTQYETAKASL